VVEPGTLQDDLFRRDFTINAMAISINKDDFGALVDYFSGKRDLSAKKIRVLHDLSFIDDPTRILREVRFEQRYGFRIEAKTLRLLKEALRLKMLEKVQPQRTRDDLILCLKEECPLKEVKRLQNLGGFGFISRHLSVSRNTYALLRSIESQIKWYKKTFPHRRHLDTWLLYFMGMIDALSLKEARQVCRKFALRRGEKKRVLSFKALRRPFITALSKKNAKPSGIYARLEPLSYETMILIRAKYGNPALAANINAFLRDYNGMRIRISGEDLRALGLTPGKRYQKIFRQVLNARLDGRIRTREEELALAAKLAKQ
jgi:tRNA nucleotidyltransferase (CCA-adding enzyme)